MESLSLVLLAVFFLFFIIYFFQTQEIYSKDRFKYLFLISLAIPGLLFFVAADDKKLDTLNYGLLIFYYTLLLWLIKINYKRVNQFFVDRKLVDINFSNKDFTLSIYSDYDDDTWDEKLSSPPSWLDKVLSYLLLILPVLFIILVNYLIDTFFR